MCTGYLSTEQKIKVKYELECKDGLGKFTVSPNPTQIKRQNKGGIWRPRLGVVVRDVRRTDWTRWGPCHFRGLRVMVGP